MADENVILNAKNIYSALCDMLDKRNWHYSKHEEDMVVSFTVSGEDLPMEFILVVDAEKEMVRLLSKLPFTVPEDKRMDLAIATCHVTNKLVDGSFDYDMLKGVIYFRVTASFKNSKIGEGLLEYLVDVSGYTVDRFNDKLFAISKGIVDIKDFIKD